jgi:alkylhydroperoxidase/carboxymuconolactone decarboxylase family protein YurZ
MGFISENFPEFSQKFEEIDKMYAEKRLIDEKNYQFICFELDINGRSALCVKKHFIGAVKSGASLEEIAYIIALTEREIDVKDDCRVNDVLGDYRELLKSQLICC